MRLTILQRIVLWVGVGLVLLVGLFPPWVDFDRFLGRGQGGVDAYEHLGGYRFLFAKDDNPTRVDGRMWFVNVATIILATVGIMLALPRPRNDSDRPSP